MSDIGRNIKKIRIKQNMTQDELAGKVHVTRQTISNWERGINQPDIDTLLLLAQAMETDANELIYGCRKEEGYKKYQKLFFVRIAISAAVIIATIILEYTLVIYLRWMQHTFARGWEEMLFYMLTVRSACVAAVSTIILSIVALFKEISVTSPAQKACLAAGIIIFAMNLFYIINLILLMNIGSLHWIFSIPFVHNHRFISYLQVYIVPFFGGALMFFGTVRR